LRLELDFHLILLIHAGILQLEVFDFQVELFDERVLIHLVLIEQGYAAGIAVGLDHDVDGLALDLSLLYLGVFLVAQVTKLVQRVPLHHVELYLGAVAVVAVALAAHPKLDDPLLSRLHLNTELVGLLLSIHSDELFLLEHHRLAKVLILLRLVLVVVVDVTGQAASHTLDVDVAGVLVNALLLGKLLMQQHDFVEEFVVGGRKVLVFGELYAMLAIE
jgi:hypothetical protein